MESQSMIILSIVVLIKKTKYKWVNIFLNRHFFWSGGVGVGGRGDVKVELDLSNYALKADLKLATGVDTFKFAKQTDLASLKSEIDKSGIIKLETASVALSKLRN